MVAVTKKKPIAKRAIKRKAVTSSTSVAKEWRDLLCSLPGYDPFKLPGDSWFDPSRAQRAINFIEKMLTHIEGALAKHPFILERWQKAIVANLFGWVQEHKRTGVIVRRFREALIYVPRKNGKTPLVAAIANTVMFLDHEHGAQGYCLAGDSEQATYLFRQMKGQILNEPELDEMATILGGDAGNARRIIYKETDSFMAVISAIADTKHGGNSHFVAIDELHVQPDRDLVDTVQTSFASENRLQPLFIMLTTADFDRPSICNEVYDYACKVRDGIVEDPAFLPVVYEAMRTDNWKDPRVWAKANPNLGVSVSLDYLERFCMKAQEQPAAENAFKRLHLNMRTEQDVRIISMDRWDSPQNSFPLNINELLGRRCYGGLDLASREDLASMLLAFPFPDDVIKVLSFSWCPEDKVAARAKKRISYDLWAQREIFHAGGRKWHALTATSGNRIDHRFIRGEICELGKLFEIVEIGFDAREATEIVQNLQDQDGFQMVEVAQTFTNLSAPTKDLISRVNAGTFHHFANPVLRWAASNCAVHFQGRVPVGEDISEHLDKVPIMPSKQRSADKIDPITAAVIAMSRLMAHPDDHGSSIYEQQGLMVI